MKINTKLIHEIVKALGFDSLNKMQEEMLEKGLANENLVVYAPTGTGKTLGFLLTLLHYHSRAIQDTQTLVIVPSRELALQIEQVFRNMDTGWKVNSCYGGHSIKTEINNFKEPPAILIGTPGRIADHLKRMSFNTENISLLVLDEFDKSLELGFGEDMRFILGKLNNIKKRILTSATRMKEIPDYTGLKKPEIVYFDESAVQPKLFLRAVRAKNNDKLEALKRLIWHLGNNSTMIFCNHREAVERISDLLREENIDHDIFHGGLDQEERQRVLIKFRNGSLNLLISTDLASRGLDIPEIKNIIHYQLPSQNAVFIHRNGRTARMEAEGFIWLILGETESTPSFLEEEPEMIQLPQKAGQINPPEWITLYFGEGKKEKIGKKDIVGLLIQKGGLSKEDIGLIIVQDYSSFAAVKRDKIKKTLLQLKDCKIKGKKIKIAVSA